MEQRRKLLSSKTWRPARFYDIKNLVERLPEEEQDDVDAVMNLMDWEANVDPHYKKHYFRPPVMDSKEDGVYEEKLDRLWQPLCGRQGADRISRPDGYH